MAQLAIKGHKEKGAEVIALLEMLGGENPYAISTAVEGLLYTISNYDNRIVACFPTDKFASLTLEEFLGKFPYKVGDKVLYKIYGIHSKIRSMLWNKEKEQVFYRLESNKLFVATADELKPL